MIGRVGAAALGGHLAVMQWAWEHGCPWSSATCNEAAGGGWRCCSGCGSAPVHGTGRRVNAPPWAGTWRRCSGRGNTTVRVTHRRVNRRQRRAPGDAAVGAGERLHVAQAELRVCLPGGGPTYREAS